MRAHRVQSIRSYLTARITWAQRQIPPTDYFALAQALERKKVAGIASWVMRKHSYVGALIAQQGYLMMITLRHAEEVIPVTQLDPPAGRALGDQGKRSGRQADRGALGPVRSGSVSRPLSGTDSRADRRQTQRQEIEAEAGCPVAVRKGHWLNLCSRA